MSYLLLPDLVAILWMVAVLFLLRRRDSSGSLRLWITGLVLVVVQGVAWVLYSAPLGLPHGLSTAFHIVGLNANLLAGFAFLLSSTGRLDYQRRCQIYLTACVVPQAALVTCYAAGIERPAVGITISVLGLLLGIGMTLGLGRPRELVLVHAAIWLPVLGFAAYGDLWQATFLLLFDVYLATAVAFRMTLPKDRWGRSIVVISFALWSLGFLIHVPVLRYWPQWRPLADKIWDLQKFLVTFGLLILTLEEDSASKEHLALHDTLTGLPNRRLFHDRLTQALAHTARRGGRLVLFNIDLDCFKEVNDRWGHQVGDALLQEIGRRLGSVTRQSDTLARIGGDEFQILIQDFAPQLPLGSPGDRLEKVCAQVRESFRSEVEKLPFLIDHGGFSICLEPQLSIGAALYPEEASDLDALCRVADQQMYRDKRARAALAGRTPEPSALRFTSQPVG